MLSSKFARGFTPVTKEEAIAAAKELIKISFLENIGEVCDVFYLERRNRTKDAFKGLRNEWSISFNYDLPESKRLIRPNSLTVLVDDETTKARFLAHSPSQWD